MTPQEFLALKNIHSLDTKKRTEEVYQWMQQYADQETKELREELEKKEALIQIMNKNLSDGRDYLMQVGDYQFNIQDCFESFGFGRNGLRVITDLTIE